MQLIASPSSIVDLGVVGQGGSQSHYLSIDGVVHISKCTTFSNGAWVCFNEFLAARLAAATGLPAPPFRVVQFQGGLPTPQMWFCSERIDAAATSVGYDQLANRNDLAGVIVFDLWLCNTDRKPEHMIIESLPDGTHKGYMIDHGHILLTSGTLEALDSDAFVSGGQLWGGNNTITAAVRTTHELADAIEKIGTLDSELIADLVRESPVEWIPDQNALESLTDLLLRRRGKLIQILGRNFGKFPNIALGVA